MLELLYKRKTIRDFMNLYSSDSWGEIIPDLCEIAILNLKTSFNTLHFTKEDIEGILYELRNQGHSSHYVPKEPRRKYSAGHEYHRKASSSWRGGNTVNQPLRVTSGNVHRVPFNESRLVPTFYKVDPEKLKEENRKFKRSLSKVTSKWRKKVEFINKFQGGINNSLSRNYNSDMNEDNSKYISTQEKGQFNQYEQEQRELENSRLNYYNSNNATNINMNQQNEVYNQGTFGNNNN